MKRDRKAGLAPYWRELAAYGADAFPHAGSHFVDFHCALVAAATGEGAALDRRIAELETLQAAGKLAPGAFLIALCRGVQAFGQGDYENAVTVLEPLLADIVRIGGSHAQREVYEDTLIVACLRAGRAQKARALIDDRLHRRPSRRDEAWRLQADTGQQRAQA
jgi:predicted phosphodiesterase